MYWRRASSISRTARFNSMMLSFADQITLPGNLFPAKGDLVGPVGQGYLIAEQIKLTYLQADSPLKADLLLLYVSAVSRSWFERATSIRLRRPCQNQRLAPGCPG